MKELKFLHCADIHLDMPFTSLRNSEDMSYDRRQDLKDTFVRILDIASEEKVDLILISGDLYEHSYVKKSTIDYINSKFAKIPKTTIVIVPGNADPCIVNSYYKDYRWSENVHILTEGKNYIILDDLGACVYGVEFKDVSKDGFINHRFKSVDRQKINIMLYHGALDAGIGQNDSFAINIGDLAALGMDYIALGHSHNTIYDIGGCGNIYNPGSPEPLGFEETGVHGVFLGRIAKSGNEESELSMEFRQTNTRFYYNVDVDITGCNTSKEVFERIEASIGGICVTDDLLYVTLKGSIYKGGSLCIDDIQAGFKDRYFYVKVKDETEAAFSLHEVIKEPGIRGLFARKILDLINKTENEYEKRLLMKAFYYGVEAMEQGRVDI
ncbi:MAG: DNA repair exonuclease [Clostridia bacterium]|nr:DNA repair exonuclease [Clostridia bacterium]